LGEGFLVAGFPADPDNIIQGNHLTRILAGDALDYARTVADVATRYGRTGLEYLELDSLPDCLWISKNVNRKNHLS